MTNDDDVQAGGSIMFDKRFLFELPEMNGAEPVDVTVKDERGSLQLRFRFDGSLVQWGFDFSRVRSYVFTAESHCVAEQIEGAYDRLVEVQNSAWVQDLYERGGARTRKDWSIRHFQIYIGDWGCLEVAGANWAMADTGRQSSSSTS